ncbi:MAG: nicotinate (nicotinamide) nucleotide adenylyltransferase [Candidatus Zixiibacteriota bacterium]
MTSLRQRLAEGSHWGLLGGAFDPPHRGHTRLAVELCGRARLDGAIFVPTAHPAHRPGSVAGFDDRLEMTGLACDGENRFFVSDIERDIPPPTFTIRVIEVLRDRCPDVRFSVLIGTDNLRILPEWREIDRLVRIAPVIVGARPGEKREFSIPDRLRDFVTTFEIEGLEISSSEIRRRVSEGLSIESLVTPAVSEHIRRRRLYL